MSLKPAVLMIVAIIGFTFGVCAESTGANQSSSMAADINQRYIVTNKIPVGAPFYTNNTPGAVHMMKASNGVFYSYVGSSWNIFRSNNLAYWTLLPEKATPNGTWGKADFWVPEVLEYNSRFYMFYCARSAFGRPSQRIGLAIADRPEGPFQDIGHPLFDGSAIENWYVIDPNPFIDPDTGEKFIYFVYLDPNSLYIDGLNTKMQSSRIYGIRLADDLQSVVGEPTLLVEPSQSWEYTSYTQDRQNRLWIEAPEIMKINGMYYITYSSNLYTTDHYNIGYASSSHPLGPYQKFDLNPAIGSIDPPQKAGHNSVVRSLDGSEYFTAYQATNDARFLSRVGTRFDGTLYVNGPMRGPQVMPSGTTNYVNHAKQAKVTVSSTKEGYRSVGLTDGEIGVYARLERYDWVSAAEDVGAWVRLSWDKPVITEYVMLHDSAVPERKIKSGHMMLNDDPAQVITGINFPDGTGEAAILRFPELKELNSLTFYVDEMEMPGGVAAMSEIGVIGHPDGYIWLSSPLHNTVIAGTVPIDLRGLKNPIAQVKVELHSLSTDDIRPPVQLYSGSQLPEQLTLDTLRFDDGPYDLVYEVIDNDGAVTTIKHRVIIQNWDILEDAVEPPTTGWLGVVQHMQTVAATDGWEFVGNEGDKLFGDADRIRRKSSANQSLTWKLAGLAAYTFTLYAGNSTETAHIKVDTSVDGETWIPVTFTFRTQEQSVTGWQKLFIEGSVDIKDAAYLKLTILAANSETDQLELGHVSLRGLKQQDSF